MSATITLPLPLRVRLTVFRWRIRMLRAVRGLSLLVVVLGILAAAAVIADYQLDLPALVRQIVLAIWLAAGAACLLRAMIVPLCRRIDTEALAAVIEEKYPDLGERLSSAVELAGAPPEGHGSPLLIALLVQETAQQSERLDFRSAVPARLAVVLAVLAAATVLLIAAPALLWPQRYGELSQRFLRPWEIAPIEAPAEIAQTPAAPAVVPVELAADSPTITITPPAYARSVKDEETYHGLVDLAPLQYSEMRFDFRFTRPVVAAHLEFSRDPKGSANALASGSRLNENVAANPEFSRDPKGSASANENTDRHPLALSEDRQEASLKIPAVKDGNYRLILEAEHGSRFELPGGIIHVLADQPPSVQRFAGPDETRGLLPYERFSFEIEAVDDIRVAGIELEYRINDGEAVRQPLELKGANTPLAAARFVLELADKVQEGDRFSYHFRISDNLPKEHNGPHVLIYPADRWMTLPIARYSDVLNEKEIVKQRDEIDRRLQAIREALLQEKRAVDKVELDTLDEVTLPPEQREKIQQLQGDNRANQKALREAAQSAETPAGKMPSSPSPLQPIAEMAREVADKQMQKSQQALEKAPKEATLPERVDQLKTAEEQLGSAVKKLDELKKMNDQLTQEQLDRAKLAMLSQREKRLAEEAAKLEGKDPALDPKAREKADQLKREQAEVAEELQRLAQKSKPLKDALEQARQEEARNLAKQARELAQSQRDLAKEEKQNEQKRNEERFAELAHQQQELAQQEKELAKQTRSAAPAARTPPLKPEESQRAADSLQKAKPAEAALHQDEAAKDLDRLAQAFERAAKASDDPKEEARQLRQAEKALKQRLQEETAKKDDKQPLDERLKPLEEEQDAIRRAAEKLSVPPDNAESKKLKQQIGERAEKAAEAMRKKDAAKAQTHMEETKNLLQRLSDSLPNLDQRREKARREVERLRRQQEDIARQVEQTKKDDPKAAQRLADAAKRQAKTAEELGKLDTPKQEESRDQAKQALEQARDDLKEGKQQKTADSQNEAKRQLERLAKQLSSPPPRAQRQPQEQPEGLPRQEQSEKARRLAQQQRELRDAVRRAEKEARSDRRADPQQDKQRQLQDEAGEVSRRLQRLAQDSRKSPSKQSALQRATDNARQAEQAMKQARDQAKNGQSAAEKQSQERAAQKLERTASAAEEAGRSSAKSGEKNSPSNEGSKAGQSVAKAGQQMADAQNQLNRGQAGKAQSAMRQAAKSLGQAAQQMAAVPGNPQGQPGKPGKQSGDGQQGGGGLPDLSALGIDKSAYEGKSWGELPGELRTKIIQDMKARYGDDYARMIKAYFEQIADTKKK